VPSKRGRTQSIAAYIGGNTGTKPRHNSHNLRIDQAEQLEFPGLDPTSLSQAKATSASTPSAASDISPAKISSGSGIQTAGKQAPQQTHLAQESKQPATAANFIAGTSNQLAYTALSMVCQDPKTASPIFFCGPTGTGKTHLMSAIADQLRRRHRMRRVVNLSAEQFTNDFISSVGNSGITAFRRRYREVDALLIDDVQFLGAKKATLREMLYTVETLATEGRALIFSGLQSPSEIPGLSHELAGRMASGLVCPLQPLDIDIRRKILERWIAERCPLEVPAALLDQITPMLAGDGRVASGVANMIGTLQRMFGRVPTLDEIRQFGGNLLRASTPIATLSVIETAVCDAFHLPHHTLRGRSQTRAVTGPRMLAMYLARQLTASAYSEIATHFGGKSHSTAISAENNVKKWLENGKSIGRGQLAMSTREAVARVENLLRSG
jgi:chromosomal replication initiator protein